jgi:peptidoglycan/xylan/chitin deacetylase (PgdA/CDA1 family)
MAWRRVAVATCLATAVVAVAAGCGASRPSSATPATSSPAPHGGSRSAASVDSVLSRLAAEGRPVYCGGPRPYAAFTFDDGPGPYTSLALRVLRAAHTPATFFLVGRKLALFPQLPRREARNGALGDHTWSHPFLPGLPPPAIYAEIANAKAAIDRYSGAKVRLFRPPYEGHNAAVDETAQRLGLVEVLWSVDSADSLGANHTAIKRNVLGGLRPGAIVLMHENRGQTIRALAYRILPALRHSRLKLVTVPQLLALDPPSQAQLEAGLRGCR